MNKSKTALATLSLAAAAAFAGSAFAQAKETGAYVGLSLGQANAADTECAGGFSCDNKDTSWKIFGGYQFMRYLAAEAAYTDLGKTKATASLAGISSSIESKSHAWELVAVGSYPIGTSGFAPYVKAGLYTGETKGDINVTVGGASSSQSFKKTNTDWTAGIGVRYDFLRNFAVRLEWQRYNGVSGGNSTASVGGVTATNSGESAVDIISIGALYKF
jgi:OOP family OmpA-OmpF porin